VLLALLLLAGFLVAKGWSSSGEVSAANIHQPLRRANVPYLGIGPPAPLFIPSIFWFGQVTPASNYADVRMWYFDAYVKVMINIIDRRVWYDSSPSEADLAAWDAVTLYLNLDGNTDSAPTPTSYRFVAQFHQWEPDDNYQVVYRGNGVTWTQAAVSLTANTVYRGNSPNDDIDDKGWQIEFVIPFSSLGLSSKPAKSTNWGLAVAVHDRDNAGGNPVISDQVWPEALDPDVPGTWGQLNFGVPGYSWPDAAPKGVVTIRQG
jgi:hypothetical protein